MPKCHLLAKHGSSLQALLENILAFCSLSLCIQSFEEQDPLWRRNEEKQGAPVPLWPRKHTTASHFL